MATQTLLTAEEFDRLPVEDGQRLELLEGEIVQMASANLEHQDLVGALIESLRPYLRQQGGGRVIPDCEFALGEQRLRPDLAILSATDWASVLRRKVPAEIVPLIAVEIVSPSELASQLQRKTQAYLDAGVREVWILYPDLRDVYIYVSNGATRFSGDSAITSTLLPGWQLRVNHLFLGL